MRTAGLCLFVTLMLATACRTDDDIVSPTTDDLGWQTQSEIVGMYVLCEGNMGSNKATLDYLDLQGDTARYWKNIFPSRNPGQVMMLGDVGNDCKVYGSRLWLVINCSNKVEVCTADSAFSLGHVDVPNCRYVCFDGGQAYVSSYVGPVNGTSVLGSVYRIDTLTLRVTGQVAVGYQPEEMAVVDGKLYVANSGGYEAIQGRSYDRTVSVVDLQTFQVEQTIDVAPNLFRLRADRHGQLWVTTRGDYGDSPSRLYLLRKNAQGIMEKADSVDVAVSDLTFRGDSLCFMGTSYDENWNRRHTFGVINVTTLQPLTTQLVKDPSVIETAYGLMVHPLTGDIYVMDATNYVSSGRLFCFDADGQLKWKTLTGDIPGHACFLRQSGGVK